MGRMSGTGRNPLDYSRPPRRTPTSTNRVRRSVAVAVLLAVGIGVPLIAAMIDWARWDRAMDAAEQHVATVRLIVAKEPRFNMVEADAVSGHIRVSGLVESDADLSALEKVIFETRSPVPIAWNVRVRAHEP